MGTPLRVLLVEDSEDDAALVVLELQRNGYEPVWQRVETAEDMAAALAGSSWDLVISDHTMPRFSGPAALALVRQRGFDLPVIIVSGTIGEEAAVEAMKAGAQDFILKGRLARLPGAVERELREAELRRTHAQTQEALQKTRHQLDGAMQQLLQAEKLTALGELVAGVAHEINNPLSSIMGYAQLLLGRDLTPDVKRRLETIFSEAERIGRIVKNLLTFARKHPPEKKWLGLNGIFDKTLELKAYHFRVSQIRVEKELASDLPMTMLDFHQIQQVLFNLLNNAEQAMAEAGRGGTIRLTTRRVGDRIEARISDDGPGVPVEIQTRIFEPFFTTKKEGKGTGLGLSLCYGIIQEHGGTIRVEGPPGTGATFVIELPVIKEKDVSTKTAPATPSPVLPGLRILVIDDEQGVQNFLADLLTSMGHKLDTASDAPEAMKKIAANGHDLIISDMKMPNGSGKDIYKATLLKNPRLAQRIIFTTGDGASVETLRFLRETGNEIVSKPFRIEDIERAIARAIRN